MFNCKEISKKHKSNSDETIEYQITQLLSKAQIKQHSNEEKMEIGKENNARQGKAEKMYNKNMMKKKMSYVV